MGYAMHGQPTIEMVGLNGPLLSAAIQHSGPAKTQETNWFLKKGMASKQVAAELQVRHSKVPHSASWWTNRQWSAFWTLQYCKVTACLLIGVSAALICGLSACGELMVLIQII